MLDAGASVYIGRSIGKYRLQRVIGAGGMAVVYEAAHRNGHRVALKMLRPALSINADLRARFLREGYAANRVNHRGAVRILDDDTSDGVVFLVMELLEGRTLATIAQSRGGTLALGHVCEVGSQLLDILASAHRVGVFHRDIKPENILIDPAGNVKVLDFGIASIREPGAVSNTATGRMLGTPAFMPPEQAYGRKAEIDARSDLWSVGATLFAILTGRLVHQATTAEETLIRAATEPAPKLASVWPEVPPRFAAVIDGALEMVKTDRFESADEMRAALEEFHRSEFSAPIASRVQLDDIVATARVPPPAVTRWMGRRVLWPGLIFVLAGVALASMTSPRMLQGQAGAVTWLDSAAREPTNPAADPAPAIEPEGPPSTALPPRIAKRPLASPRPTATSVTCGFEFDSEGRKWPRRCEGQLPTEPK